MPVVIYEKAGAVGVVTLNRPRVLNAYNTEMRDGLYEAFSAVRDDPEVRAMVLCGNGPAFCTGGDLREFGTAPSPVMARRIRWLRDVWGVLWRLPKVTVAAVHGLAVGGGFEMALLCDQVVATTGARFFLPETGLGMIPGVGGTQTLPRLVGAGVALDLILTGRAIDARTARRLGLVQKLTPPGKLFEAALHHAQRLIQLDSSGAGSFKRRPDFARATGAARDAAL